MKWYLVIAILALNNIASAQKLNYDVKDLNNKWVKLEALTGKHYTIIDFWATWCKPCVNALPKINELYKDYNSNHIKFIGVNIDGTRNQSKIKPFIRSLEIDYSIILDPNQEIMNDLNVSVMPTLIILDGKQNEIFRHEGFHQGDEKIIENKLKQLSSE